LTVSKPNEHAGNARPAAQWRSLCERFHEIRLGASRHNLLEAWQQLIRADPDDLGTLAGWLRLDERIRHLDEQESQGAVRHGTSDGETASDDKGADSGNWDDWEGWGDEYGCPVRRCERKVKAFLGAAPRCELFGVEMTPFPVRPGG
jgi:hypothetical protein